LIKEIIKEIKKLREELNDKNSIEETEEDKLLKHGVHISSKIETVQL
jgi:hypothetical protein